MEQVNIKNLDIVKFIMAIFVVSLHTLPFYDFEESYLSYLWWILAQSTVPIFFIISGYLIGYKENINLTATGTQTGGYIKISILKNCKVYILWSMAYMPLAVWFYVSNNFSVKAAIISYVRELFLSGQHYNSWILWYILSTVYSLIIIYVLTKLSKNNYYRYLPLLCVCATILYFGAHIVLGKTDVNSTIRLLNGCIYIPIGMLLYKYLNESKYTNRGLLTVCALGLLVLSIVLQANNTIRFVLDFLIIFLATILFFLIITSKESIPMDTLVFRKISEYVFFLHLYVWTIWYYLMYGQKRFGFKAFIYTSTGTMLLALVVYIIKNRKLKAR